MGKIPAYLHLRNHTYYIRVALPKKFWELVQRKEVCYTLHTKDYLVATRLLKKEVFKVELLYKWLEQVSMEIKDNVVHLTPEELKQMLSFQLRKIENKYQK